MRTLHRHRGLSRRLVHGGPRAAVELPQTPAGTVSRRSEFDEAAPRSLKGRGARREHPARPASSAGPPAAYEECGAPVWPTIGRKFAAVTKRDAAVNVEHHHPWHGRGPAVWPAHGCCGCIDDVRAALEARPRAGRIARPRQRGPLGQSLARRGLVRHATHQLVFPLPPGAPARGLFSASRTKDSPHPADPDLTHASLYSQRRPKKQVFECPLTSLRAARRLARPRGRPRRCRVLRPGVGPIREASSVSGVPRRAAVSRQTRSAQA
jgi:hypothetical protein